MKYSFTYKGKSVRTIVWNLDKGTIDHIVIENNNKENWSLKINNPDENKLNLTKGE